MGLIVFLMLSRGLTEAIDYCTRVASQTVVAQNEVPIWGRYYVVGSGQT